MIIQDAGVREKQGNLAAAMSCIRVRTVYDTVYGDCPSQFQSEVCAKR